MSRARRAIKREYRRRAEGEIPGIKSRFLLDEREISKRKNVNAVMSRKFPVGEHMSND